MEYLLALGASLPMGPKPARGAFIGIHGTGDAGIPGLMVVPATVWLSTDGEKGRGWWHDDRGRRRDLI